MPEGDDTFGELVEATDQAQGHTRREGDRANMPGVVHSDSSSPNPGDLAVEGLPLSPADRKRNKLGYHRTAVACGQSLYLKCSPDNISNHVQATVDGAKSDAYLPSKTLEDDAKIAFA